MEQVDVAIIGSGPGGYVAAIRCAQHGLKTVVIEKDKRLGGTCLLRGCIPTKALLHAADTYQRMQHASAIGIQAKGIQLHMDKVQEAKGQAVSKGEAGIAYLMKKNNIQVIHGHGKLQDPHTIAIHGQGPNKKATQQIQAKAIILATGSTPRILPFVPIDGQKVVTSDHLLDQSPTTLPKRLVVLGSGAVGSEFASMYARFGSQTTLIEMQPRILPIEDHQISGEFAKALKKQGITIQTHTTTKAIKTGPSSLQVICETEGKAHTIEADMVLSAMGRAPVTQDLNLEALGIRVDNGGFVEVDGMMRSSIPHIYAIGDIVRTPWLAHVASAEGILAADHIAQQPCQAINYLHVPSCTYTTPEVASVGLSEQAAIDRGLPVKVATFPFSAVQKARILGETAGMVKLVADPTYGELLGVHILGPHATDLIGEAVLAMRMEVTAEELAQTIHAHPTLAEGVGEAAHAWLGHAIHI